MNAESRPVKAAIEDLAGGQIASNSTESPALSLIEIDALLWRYVSGEVRVLDVPGVLMSWLHVGAEEVRGELDTLRDENVALRSRLAHTMRADMPAAERTEHVLRLLDEAAQGVPHMQHGDDPDRWVDEYLSTVWARFIDALDVPEAVVA